MPSGDIALWRACEFQALLQDVVSRALSDDEAPTPHVASISDQPKPVRFMASALDLQNAVVRDQRFGEFAAVMVVAEEDGVVRDVTAEEARTDSFPVSAFTEAFPPFLRASSGLTSALLGIATDTPSPQNGTAGSETTRGS